MINCILKYLIIVSSPCVAILVLLHSSFFFCSMNAVTFDTSFQMQWQLVLTWRRFLGSVLWLVLNPTSHSTSTALSCNTVLPYVNLSCSWIRDILGSQRFLLLFSCNIVKKTQYMQAIGFIVALDMGLNFIIDNVYSPLYRLHLKQKLCKWMPLLDFIAEAWFAFVVKMHWWWPVP